MTGVQTCALPICLFVHGDQDRVAPIKEVTPLIEEVGAYLDRRLGNPPRVVVASRKD